MTVGEGNKASCYAESIVPECFKGCAADDGISLLVIMKYIPGARVFMKIDFINGDLPEGYKTVKHPKKTIAKNKLFRVAMNKDFDARYKFYPGKTFILNGDYVYFTANMHQSMPSYHRYSLMAFYRSDYWFMVGDKFKLKVLQKIIEKVLVGKDNIVYDYFEILERVE